MSFDNVSDFQTIKDIIYKEKRVEFILDRIGCENISVLESRVEAQLPQEYGSENKRSVQVYLNSQLTSRIRNKPDFGKGDIFHLVSYIYHKKRGEEIAKDVFNAKKYICAILGINGDYDENRDAFRTKIDYVEPLKALLRDEQEVKSNKIIEESVMDNYYYKGKPLPYIPWIEEGIPYETQVKYHVGIDLDSKRIVFPLRNKFGQIVGVKGRIIKDEDDIDRKYLYIHKCYNSLELFNWHNAYECIQKEKVVYILESEKSCMKLDANNIHNSLALGSSEISKHQENSIKSLGKEVKIVLCYDKGIEKKSILEQAKKFKGFKIYAMYDVANMLKDKNSPIDEGIDVWNKLIEKFTFPINL